MCNGDILKHDTFFELNWLYVLNVKSMELQQAKDEEKMRKKKGY